MLPNGTYHCDKLQMIFLPTVYSVEFLVALVGNGFALFLLVKRERKNWHICAVLSCNLAISDLLYIMSLPLLIVYYKLEKHWIFGDTACKLERFLFNNNLYASIFFIMGISVNRCVALAYPFFTRGHLRPSHIKVVSVIIWILAAAICGPIFKFSSICSSAHTNKTQCVSFCNNSGHGTERDNLNYNIFLAVCGCLVPFLVTFTSYCVVIRVVWKNANISTLEKRKVALMVISVIGLYVISFVPYHIFQIYHLYLKILYPNHFFCWVYNLYQVSKGLATLNMCIHPLLYMAVLDSIRIACCGKSREDTGRRDTDM